MKIKTNYIIAVFSGFLIISLNSFAIELRQERRATRFKKTHEFYSPYGIARVSEDIDVLPGNDSFGFFTKSIDENNKICRVRIKVYCDYKFGVTKPVKEKNIELIFDKKLILYKTESNGLLDFLFDCKSDIEKKRVEIRLNKYKIDTTFSNFPKELAVEEENCG